MRVKLSRLQTRFPARYLLLLTLFMGCGGEKLDTITMNISEMRCPEYQTIVQETIMAQTGIKELSLNWETRTVIVTIRPDQISADALTQALLDAGFTVNGSEGDA
ncbi:MAG: hypothetical protein AUJ47_10265, partial [Candidatus Marinimicrobia bacterium CG1_02_48_14]